MTPLDRMLAEHEIARLTVRFALLNDAGDWAAVADMFTEDARFVRPAGGDPVVGRKAIHLITNIVVNMLSENEAASRCTLMLYAAPAGEANAASPALIGGFTDKLVRTADGWRFSERVGFLDLKVALP